MHKCNVVRLDNLVGHFGPLSQWHRLPCTFLLFKKCIDFNFCGATHIDLHYFLANLIVQQIVQRIKINFCRNFFLILYWGILNTKLNIITNGVKWKSYSKWWKIVFLIRIKYSHIFFFFFKSKSKLARPCPCQLSILDRFWYIRC